MGAYTSEAYTNLLTAAMAACADFTNVPSNQSNASVVGSPALSGGNAYWHKANSGGDPFLSPGGDVGSMRLGMTAGTTYTFSAAVYIPSAFATSATIWLYDHTSSGYDATFLTANGSLRDQWQRIAIARTIRSGADAAFLRLHNDTGTSESVGIYWDELMLEVGNFTGKNAHTWVAGGSTGVSIASVSY